MVPFVGLSWGERRRGGGVEGERMGNLCAKLGLGDGRCCLVWVFVNKGDDGSFMSFCTVGYV